MNNIGIEERKKESKKKIGISFYFGRYLILVCFIIINIIIFYIDSSKKANKRNFWYNN